MKERIFQNKPIGVLLTLLVCALWGSLYPFIKIGYQAFSIDAGDIPSIMLFAGIRFAVCGAILVVFLARKEKGGAVPRGGQWTPILLVALFTIVLHYGLTYVGLALGEGSKGAILKQVGFLFLGCFSFLFVKEERFSTAKLLSGILGFFGIVVTAMDGSGVTFALGDALLVLSSFCTVCSAVISKRAFSRVSPVLLVAYSQLIGGACLLLGGLCLGGLCVYLRGFDFGLRPLESVAQASIDRHAFNREILGATVCGALLGALAEGAYLEADLSVGTPDRFGGNPALQSVLPVPQKEESA